MKSDGTVWAWGRNQQGQLGDGTTTDSTTPVQVSGLSGVVAIAAGGATSFALKSDGTEWAWGRNDVGQLGTSAAGTNSTVPVPVSITSVTKIGAGATHGLALRSDGSAWAWGNDVNGELGDGGSCGTSCTTPVQVSNVTQAALLAGGEIHSLAVKSDGTVWAWGGGAEGQLGNGATTDSFTPVQVSNLSGVSRTISATYSYDGDEKRASKTVGSTTTSYVYDVNGSLPNVLTDGTLKYVYGLGLAFALDGSGNVQVYHTDGLGSVRAITDANGNLIAAYTTDEFGIPTQTQGTSTQPFQFTGQQNDPESGLYYLRARMYDPSIGRFMQQDPRDPLLCNQTTPSTLDRYGYAEGNPTSRVDPTGQKSQALIEPPAAVDQLQPQVPPIWCISLWTWWEGWTQICFPDPTTTITPARNAWSCTASCNVEGPPPVCGGRVTGAAMGSTEDDACREAKRVATQSAPRGCYARHCQCRCTKR